jgi:hypothetical protein
LKGGGRMNFDVNFWAILVAAIFSMVVGSVFYAKPVFGKQWQALVGLTEDQMKKSASMALLLAFVGALITAYVLWHILVAFDAETWVDGVVGGFWVWVIVAAGVITHGMFEQRKVQLIGFTVIHELVTFVVMGAVLGFWLS